MAGDPTSTLGDRLRSQLRWKVRYFAATIAVMLALYMLPQLIVFVEPTTLADSWIDDAIPFAPGWTLVYLSFYLVIIAGFSLARSRDDLRRCLRGVVSMYVPCSLFFFFVQVEGPRPEQAPRHGLWGLLSTVDKSLNTIPSLHAAILILFVVLIHRSSRGLAARTRAGLLVALWIWTALILYSTLATKQHRFVDLPAGAVVGLLGALVATRGRPATATPRPAREGDD